MEKLIYESKPYFFAVVAISLLHGSTGAQTLLRGSSMLLLAMASIIVYNRWHYRHR